MTANSIEVIQLPEEKDIAITKEDVSKEPEDSVSIISINTISCKEEPEESDSRQEYIGLLKDVCKIIAFSIGVIAICLVFFVPWTSIPRTNSIVYQSYWMESCLPNSSNIILIAGADLLNLTIWMKEKSLRSFKVYAKIFFSYWISFMLIYVSSYLTWTVHLGFNHPLPNLVSVISLPLWIIVMISFWFVLPKDLLANDELD